MSGRRRLGVLGLGIVTWLGLSAGAAPPADPAAGLPADTLLYAGMARWEDPARLRLLRRVLEVLPKEEPRVRTAEEREEEEEEGRDEPVPFAMVELALRLVERVQTGAVGVALLDLAVQGEEVRPEAVLLVAGGGDYAPLAESLRRVVADQGLAIQPRSVGPARFDAALLGESGLTLLWGTYRDCFLVALGEAAAAKVMACLDGGAPTLAQAEELKFDRAKVKADVAGRHFCFYVDVQRAVARGKAVAEAVLGGLPVTVDQVLDELGITSVKSKYLHVDRANDAPRSMLFAHVSGPVRGLVSLWQQQPVTDDDLKVVPRDAYWMQVNNLDLARLWRETLRIVEQVAPDARPKIDGMLAASQRVLGFSLTTDLLPALGDTWALFDAPEHGGLLLTGTVLVAEVKDRTALEGMLTRLTELLAGLTAEAEVDIRTRTLTHEGHTIRYLVVGGAPVPVMPAWCLVGDRLVVGINPQTVATAARQVDPQTRGPSILEHPDFRSARARLPQTAIGVGYSDARYLTRLFYPWITGLATAGFSMLSEHDVELDLAALPPLPELLAKTTNYVGTTSLDPDGVLYASIGDCGTLTAAAAVLGFAGGSALPSLLQVRTASRNAGSLVNLSMIGRACHTYSAEHDGKFPATLDELVRSGSINESLLRSPRDPSAQVSYLYVAGQTAESDPRNVLAYEPPAEREKAAVLFVDGHASVMPAAQFREVLRATYERLGRSDELPAEYRD